MLSWICRPTEMILDLEDPDGGKEKLGQICAVFTVQPKNYEDRQEVVLKCIIANEPAEWRRSAGEAPENSAAWRILYAEKFSIELPKV